MKPVWLTVDSDDLRHTPKSQGHPTRSKGVIHEGTSEEMLVAMGKFRDWLDRTQVSLTIFVIADQLDDPIFKEWLQDCSMLILRLRLDVMVLLIAVGQLIPKTLKVFSKP